MKTIRTPAFSLRISERALLVSTAIAALTVAAAVATMVSGDFPLTVGEVLATFLGQGDGYAEFVIFTLRLPRLLTGLLVARRSRSAARSCKACPETRWPAPTSSASPRARPPARSR